MKPLTKELLIKYINNHCKETSVESVRDDIVGPDHKYLNSIYGGPFLTAEGYDGPSIYEDAIETNSSEPGLEIRQCGAIRVPVVPFTDVQAVNDIVADYEECFSGSKPDVTLMDFLS